MSEQELIKNIELLKRFAVSVLAMTNQDGKPQFCSYLSYLADNNTTYVLDRPDFESVIKIIKE